MRQIYKRLKGGSLLHTIPLLPFMDMKSPFKASSRTCILFSKTLTYYQINNPFFCYKLKNFLFVFEFGSIISKLKNVKRKFLRISHLRLHFSIEQLLSFIVLENIDDDTSTFKFLFRLYVTLIVFSGKV